MVRQGKDNNFYENYITKSPIWKHKRLLRLKIDKFQCRTCRNTENLEVHHLSYEHLGDEPIEDLITLCKECHHAITSVIRARRYQNKNFNQFDEITEKEINYNVETSKTSIDWGITPNYAQRPHGRSNKQSCKSDESDFWETF